MTTTPASTKREYFLELMRDLVVGSCTLAILTMLSVSIGVYGATLFFLTPLLWAFGFALWMFVRHDESGLRILGAASLRMMLMLLLFGVIALATAMEGLICLLMIAPLALLQTAIGVGAAFLIHRYTRLRRFPPQIGASLFLILVLSTGAESYYGVEAPLHKVVSEITIRAPREEVWKHVIAFEDIPTPDDWLFRAGIAYPIRARIEGHGVGAIRYCEFSTGDFVEPIEIWDEPNLLQFSVKSSPAPMKEFNPFWDTHPAHLDGYLASQRGALQLVANPDGTTTLQGITWYRHYIAPAWYWHLWSDSIIHKIHMRVLEHIKTCAERQR